MHTCPTCSTAVAPDSDRCPSCGALVSAAAADADRELTDSTQNAGASMLAPGEVGDSDSSPTVTIDHGRFLPGTMIQDRYRIVGRIGKGGMGEVYRADDLKLGQSVALKFLPDAFADDKTRLQRFLNEVRIARRVAHPNVCRVYDIGEIEGHTFLSMEFVDGEDLASLLRRIGRIPQRKAIQIARQMCAGLAAAHGRGILHRDLKPMNIMVDGRGQVRITDFGLATLIGEVGASDARAGTPAYMAPEQLIDKKVSAASDIYALGLVLYEMFTGRRPFDAKTITELTRLHA
ncbi:MAG: serine/threonine-protein kinase, partial [Phycisphaerae bacterium]